MMGYPCVRLAGQFLASYDDKAGCLVVKLPRERVAELVETGTGDPFAPAGKVFREWVVDPHDRPPTVAARCSPRPSTSPGRASAGSRDGQQARLRRKVIVASTITSR